MIRVANCQATTTQAKLQLQIDDLVIVTGIGTYPEEWEQKQTLLISLVLSVDFTAAMGSDCLSDTLDYAQLAQAIRERLGQKHHQLIEHAAANIAQLLEEGFECRHYRVCVKKPSALPEAAAVSAIIDTLPHHQQQLKQPATDQD